jgi:type IV pilus assembly protein PilM
MPSNENFLPFVAIDIGSFSLKFAFIETDEEGNKSLKTLAHLPIPPYRHELTEEQLEMMSKDDITQHCLKELRQFLTTHLTELLYDNEIQTKRAITFASNREVTIRCIEIPPVPEKEKLQEAVTSEANKQMPFSTGNAVLGYTVQGEVIREEEKALTQIMVAALQKEIIDYVNQNFKGGGLSNEGILTLPQSLEISLAKQLAPYAQNDKKVAIIHCGNSTTSVMIYKNGKIQFFRDINMAGFTITEAIYNGGELDGQEIKFSHLNEATELKHKIGVLPPDEIQNLKGVEKFAAQKIFEQVEKIFQHIQLSISFYISQSGESSLNKIILTGGSAGMTNFKEFIEESLEVPTEIADPFADITIGEIKYEEEKRETDAPGLAPVLGVANYSGDEEVINFIDILFPNRKSQSMNLSGVSSKFGGNFSSQLFQLDEKKLRIIVGLLAGLILLVGLFPVIRIRQKVTTAKNDYKKLKKKLSKLKNSQSEVTALLAKQEKLRTYQNVTKELNQFKRLNTPIILEIASITPKQIFITSTEFDVQTENPKIKILGHADNSESVFEYLNILGKSEFFSNPALETSQEVEIDEDRYFLRFTVNSNINVEKTYPDSPDSEQEEGGGEEDFF